MDSKETERTTLLKQQSTMKRVTPGQKIEQGVLFVQLLRLSWVAR